MRLEPRMILSDQMQEEIGRTLADLRAGETICLTWYVPKKRIGEIETGNYQTENVTVAGLDRNRQVLLTSEQEIPFDDIREIIRSRGDYDDVYTDGE